MSVENCLFIVVLFVAGVLHVVAAIIELSPQSRIAIAVQHIFKQENG